MKTTVVALILSALFSTGQVSPEPAAPEPITMKVKNRTRDTLRLVGFKIVSGTWLEGMEPLQGTEYGPGSMIGPFGTTGDAGYTAELEFLTGNGLLLLEWKYFPGQPAMFSLTIPMKLDYTYATKDGYNYRITLFPKQGTKMGLNKLEQGVQAQGRRGVRRPTQMPTATPTVTPSPSPSPTPTAMPSPTKKLNTP